MKFPYRALALIASASLHTAAASPTGAQTAYEIDFTDYRSGPVDAWLRSKGLSFKEDTANRQKIALLPGAQGLVIEALRPARGFLVQPTINGAPFSSIEIEWGVARHPQNASYERRLNNEAIMVHVFFGADKRPSGSPFVPDIPYFVGLFLCNGDRVGHPYVGRHYRDSGRYVCLGSPTTRDPLTSRFDLAQGIRALFGQSFARAVSGYSISVDTSSSGNQGRSSALIKRIRFLR